MQIIGIIFHYYIIIMESKIEMIKITNTNNLGLLYLWDAESGRANNWDYKKININLTLTL